MSAMFGAPVGIGAAEKDMREQVQGGLLAQKTLGEIEAQPGARALTEAHARLYGAEAALKQAQVKEQEDLANLAAGMRASQAAESQGQVLTVGELRSGKRPSMAEPLEQMFALGTEKGMNPMTLAGMAKKAAEIRQKEAAAGSAESRAKLNEIDGQHKRAELIGSMAQAALQDPTQFDQVRMAMAEQGMPANALPQDWASAKPQLQRMVMESMKAQDWLKIQRETQELKLKEPLWKAQTAKNNAGVALAKARTDLAQQTYDYKAKYEGSDSRAAQDAKKSLDARRSALTFKEMEKAYPQAPLDPKLWVEGSPYRIGSKFFIARKGPDGKMGGETITDVPAAYKVALQQQAGAATAPDNDEDLDTEGED